VATGPAGSTDIVTTAPAPPTPAAGQAVGVGAAVPAGPLAFLAGLATAAPSAFGAQLAAAATAGAGALATHQGELQEALPARPAPTGLPAAPAVDLPAPPEVAAAPLTGPAAGTPAAQGPLDASGSTDPGLADQWSAVGSTAIIGTAAVAQVQRPSAPALVHPSVDPTTLPAATIPAAAQLASPTVGAQATGEQAALLDATTGTEIHGQVASLLAPAAAAGATHSSAVTATRSDAEGKVAAAQADTLARQQAVTVEADAEVGRLHAGWGAEKDAIVGSHEAAIRAESSRVRATATQTIAAANAEAKAKADAAEPAQGAPTGLWGRMKAAGGRAVSAVKDAASAVVAGVRSILDSARQRVLGALTRLAAGIRERVAAAARALRDGVRRVAGGIAGAITKARQLVTRLASAAASLAMRIWQTAAQRLGALWQALTSAVRSALAAATAVVQRIGKALGTIKEILKLLGNNVLGTIFDALRDPQGKVIAPIVAMAGPFAAKVPEAAGEKTAQQAVGIALTAAGPVVQRAPVQGAPPGEGFDSAVWRHVKAAGRNFADHWPEILGKVILAILLWFPMLIEEGPKLWEECKGVVNGGGGVDFLDHVLGVLRHLVNIVAGTLATAGVYGMLFAWAGTPIAEAATVAAYEALSMQVLAADIALGIVEMGKAWYSGTRPDVTTEALDRYSEMYTASLISTVIASVMFVLGAIASRLAKAFKARAGGAAAAEGAEGGAAAKGAKSADERPGGGGDAAADAKSKGAPLTPEEVSSGVRMAKDLPGGGRLKLLRDGQLVVCHSPCQAIATRFQGELAFRDAEAQALKGRLDTIAEQERAAVAANDLPAEQRAFDAADVLNQDLEAFRLRRMNAATGVDEAVLRDLIRRAGDDGALVQKLLGKAANDPARVRQLLDAAGGDVNLLARLSQAADVFPPASAPSGAVVKDARFGPFATEADMPHFLERHSIDHFDFGQIRAQNHFWPKLTSPEQIKEALVEALRNIKGEGRPILNNESRITRLANGTPVTVTWDSGRVVQFFPIGGPGVTFFARQELEAIGRLLGRLPP
jgi:hypothetical protein